MILSFAINKDADQIVYQCSLFSVVLVKCMDIVIVMSIISASQFSSISLALVAKRVCYESYLIGNYASSACPFSRKKAYRCYLNKHTRPCCI